MPRKHCNKRSYESKAAAEAAIADLARRFGFVYKRPYRCGRCKAWHLTSRPWRGRKRVQH